MRTVAVLCVERNSIYKTLEGVEAYDDIRNALTFVGKCPVVTHAPCRAWSVHTRHQSKPKVGEMELAYFCANRVVLNGGIFEHPAHSKAFNACGLPFPGGIHRTDLWTIEVWQAWWGYTMMKKTWLCFSRIDFKDVRLPFKLHSQGGDRRKEQVMSKNQRARTTPELAQWLVNTARLVK